MQFSTMKLSSLMQFSAPTRLSSGDSAMEQIFDGFKLNQMVVNAIQQLIHLLADIQRHRACSLAILSDNASFDDMASSLERKIQARLAYLDGESYLTEVIDQHEWDNILNEWRVVGYSWRQDNVQHNFELHSHLVEKILNIVRDAGRWVLRSRSYSEEVANHYLGHHVFEYVFAKHLYQIETLGKLRGLGTCISNSPADESTDAIEHGMRMRIEFLMQCARQEHIVARELLENAMGSVSRHIPAMVDMQRTETLFYEWLELMTRILQGNETVSDAITRQAFDLASTVIDARLALTEQVLAYLQLAMEEMLESLLEETAQLGTPL